MVTRIEHSVIGYSAENDEMQWTVNCPVCNIEISYVGFFDSGELNKCKCGAEFKTRSVDFEDGSRME